MNCSSPFYKALKETKMIIAGLLSQFLEIMVLSTLLFSTKVTYLVPFPYTLTIFASIYVFSLAAIVSGLFKHYPFGLWDIFKRSWQESSASFEQSNLSSHDQGLIRLTSVSIILPLIIGGPTLGFLCFCSFYVFSPSFLASALSYMQWILLGWGFAFTFFSGATLYCFFDYVYESYCWEPEKKEQQKKMSFLIKHLSKKVLTPKEREAKKSKFPEIVSMLEKTQLLDTVFKSKHLGRIKKKRLLYNIAQLCPEKLWEFQTDLFCCSNQNSISLWALQNVYRSLVDKKDQGFQNYLNKVNKHLGDLLAFNENTFSVCDQLFEGKERTEIKAKVFDKILGHRDNFSDISLDHRFYDMEELNERYTPDQQDKIFEHILSAPMTAENLDEIERICTQKCKTDLIRTRRRRQFIQRMNELDPADFKNSTKAGLKILQILTNYYNEQYKNTYNLQVTVCDDPKVLKLILKQLRREDAEKARDIKERIDLVDSRYSDDFIYVYLTLRRIQKDLEQKLTDCNRRWEKSKINGLFNPADPLKAPLEKKQGQWFKMLWGTPKKALTSLNAIELGSFILSIRRKLKDYCITQEQESFFKREILTSPEFNRHLAFNRHFSIRGYENLLFVLQYLDSDQALQTKCLKQYLLQYDRDRTFQSSIQHIVQLELNYGVAILGAIQDKTLQQQMLNHIFYIHDYEAYHLKRLAGAHGFRFLKHLYPCKNYPDEPLRNSVITYGTDEAGEPYIEDPETVPTRLFEAIKQKAVDHRAFLRGLLWVSNLKKLLYFINHGFKSSEAKRLWATFLEDFEKKSDWDINLLKKLPEGLPLVLHAHLGGALPAKKAYELYNNKKTNYYGTYGQDDQTIREMEHFGRYVHDKSSLIDYLTPDKNENVIEENDRIRTNPFPLFI